MIRLEPLEKRDFIKIVEWNKGKSGDFLMQWSGPIYSYPLTVEQIEDYFNKTNANNSKDLLVFKIVMEETNEMVGTIELRKYEKAMNTGRVGRFLIGEEAARGKGIGKKALAEIVRIGFQKLNYDKVCLGVFDFNKNAIFCYEGIGFEKDRIIERANENGRGSWNLYEMSITRTKWNRRSCEDK